MLIRYFIIALSTLVVSCGGGGGSSTTGGGASTSPVLEDPVSTPSSITQFSFLQANNPTLSSDIVLTLDENSITGRVEAGIDVDSLVATVVHEGGEITVAGASQTDGVTSNDFTHPVSYKLTSPSGVETTYSVDITKFTGLPIIFLTTNLSLIHISEPTRRS